MNNFEQIKKMTVEQMAEWLENYSTNIIVTLANQIIDGCKPEKISSIEFKKFLLREVNND